MNQSIFSETNWRMVQEFITIDDEKGSIEIFYTTEFSLKMKALFLKRKEILSRISEAFLTGYINSYKARDIIRLSQVTQKDDEDIKDISSRKLLQKFLDRHNAERDVFHDLMPFKVKEILLVANLYDAYSIEGEGRFSDHMLGEYYQMSLTSIPRVTGVSGEEEAFSTA